VVSAITDCAADLRRICLSPPSVEFRKVESAVDEHFHSAGSARLRRPVGSVEPQVNTLHQMLRNDHVLISDEDDVRTHFWPAYELNPLLDHCLPGRVRRMRFACDDELHGELRIGEDAGQAVRVLEQERWTFVGCKAAREA
jgi:hypothetical protein